MMWSILLICVSFLTFGLAEYNFTDEIASKCKQYLCRSGNDYVNFFEVKGGHRSSGIKFEMHMAIKGVRDGHILLSSTSNLGPSDSVYEIVVGAGGNTYSELRRMRKKFGKVSVPTPGILSATQYRPFWIKIFDDGLVQFGIEGQDLAVLSYMDPVPIDINYFSFASWYVLEIKVLYDCPRPGSEAKEIFPDSAIVDTKPVLMGTNRLRADILTNYDHYLKPVLANDTPNIIFTHFNIKSIKYDVAKSQMTTHATIISGWMDTRLMWDKSKYDNISELVLNHRDIWVPDLMVYDSLDLNVFSSQPSQRVAVDHDGFVMRITSSHVRTWCSPSHDLARWPHDQHTCVLRIGFLTQDESMSIMDLHAEVIDPLLLKELDDKNNVSSEWEIDKVSRSSQWSSVSPHAQKEKDLEQDYIGMHNLINVTISFTRNSKTHSMLLFTPFVASVIIVLSSFWLPSSQVTKMTILTANLVYVTICLTRVLDQMPTYMPRLPNIVYFYFWSILTIWLSIIIHGILVKLTAHPRPWPYMHYKLKSFLTLPVLTMTLGLPVIKNIDVYKPMQFDTNLDPLEEADDGEDLNDEESMYWKVLVIAVDRTMFTFLIIIYTSMFFIHY